MNTKIPYSSIASIMAEELDNMGYCENCGKRDHIEVVGTGYCRQCQRDWEKFDEKCFQEYLLKENK